MFESKVLRSIPGPQSKKVEVCVKKNYIKRYIKIIFCTHHKIFFVQNFVRKTCSDHLGNLVVVGKIILRRIIRKLWYDSME